MKKTLKINDIIYKYLTFHGFSKYEVIAINEREKVILYEVECQSCQHGDEKCTLYVIDKKKGEYGFVSMTCDEETAKEQHFWHDDDLFYKYLNDGKKAKYLECINDIKKDIEKETKTLTRLNKRLDELSEHYNNLFEESSELKEVEV